ncbi:hypothetical protein OPT61_g3391 [Boeremia exigua]|uniref:Uncharacterized protein n=1 Tax=Boeremia exigua TaxID=749465 RepID=A0ACC2IHY2_9PLEO|nr:hypothetical protein OPT61_g3391 [Boeremia exigua]
MTSAAPTAGEIPTSQTRCIFICGATNPQDLWMFADFMASSKVFLKTGGIKGTYINTFPIDEFLAKNGRVAWGYKDPNSSTPLVVHNKTDQPWWKNVPRHRLKHLPKYLLNNLEKIGETARYLDKINLFLFCHRSDQGWLQLGGERLQLEDLSKVIATKFNHGVQVNVITAACYSGRLLNKIKDRDSRRRSVQMSASAVERFFSNSRVGASGCQRGSPFVAVYTSSLVLGLEAAQKKTPARTLQQHIDFVNETGVSGITQPQPYHDGSLNLLDAVLNLFLRSYIVRTFQGGEKVRQRYFTPPRPGPQPPPGAQSSAAEAASPENLHTLMKRIQPEMDKIRRQPGQNVYEACSGWDIGLFSNIYCINNAVNPRLSPSLFKEVLLSLRWRFRLQENYLFVFDELLHDELIIEKAITRPMDIDRYDKDVEDIAGFLEAFDMGAVCRLHSVNFPELQGKLGQGRFEMPLRWLAILILRSHPETELAHIISRFVTTECFGALNKDNLEFLKPFRAKDRPNASVAQNKFDAGSYELGFFLPHGVTGEAFKQWAEIAKMRYTHIRDVFEEVLGKDTWGDATKFLELLRTYQKHTLEEYLGPRLRQGEVYVEDLSPVSDRSSSGFSAAAVASSASSAPSSAGGFASPVSKKKRN